MALKGELIENFKLLTAETCTEEWVNNVWENYFTSYDGLDQTLDPETLIEVLKSLTSGLNGFVGQSSEDEEGLWTVLVENDVSIKAIIAFLGYLMSEGHKKKNASLHERELSITATQVYLKLLMVPNSGVFKTFNPVPYEHGVDYLKLYTSQAGESNKTKKKRGSGKLSIQSRNKSRSRSKDASKDCSLDDDEEEVEEMSDHEISRLRKMLYALLQDVVTLLGTLSMKSESSSACHTIQTLVKLVEVEVETFKCDFTSSTRQDRLSIPALAYKGLESLCSPLHCDKNTLINVMCKQLLPSLIMVGGDGGTNKQQHTIQNQATAFICHLVEKLGTQCIASFRSLVQHMCTKVPDKADYRSSAVQAVVIILQSLPVNIYNGLVHWIDNKLAKHKEVSNRGFAVEVVSALLELPVRQPTADVPNQAPILTHKSLIRTLVDCCSDVAPVVRARAIACFAQCLSSVDDHVAGALRDIVTPAMAQRPLGPVRLIRTPGGSESAQSTLNEEGSSRSEVTIAQQTVENSTTVTTETGQDQDEGQQKRGATPLSAVHLTPGFNPNLTDSEGTFSMLRRRARDDKVHVRKAALYSLECAVNFEGHNYTKQNVEVLKEHCRDPGLSARKQAMQSLTELLTSRIEDTFIQEKWLTGVLPLAMDREQTLADKCMELLEDLLLNNIVPYNRSNAAPHKLAWSMLTIISKPECDGHRRYLLKACRHWGRKGKIKSFVISSLESHFGTENNTGALMLLAEMIPSHSKVSSGFIQQCWTKSQDSGDPHDMLRVMKIMSNAAKHQQTEELEILIADLTSQLQDYKLSPNLIPAAISALSKLCEVHAEKNNLRKPKQWDWCIKLLASTDKYLSNDILKDPETPKNEDLVVAHLSTLGEVAQLCPGKVTKRARLLVLSIIAKPCITSVPSSQPPALDQGDNDQESTQGSQSSQGSQQTQSSQSTQPISQFRNSSWSSLVKAVAFTTLGKLCLQNEKLTKKCVAALARELEVSTDPMIRNNVMTVMCDLCVRYTTTANEYVGTIASCLKDPILLVRQQALTMITKLLQQDFLKWKGALFYRYIATVVDEDEDLADFAKTCLVVLLIKPNPNLFFQHFVECLFHFNDYQHHNTYNRFPQIDRDRELFTLKGEKNSKKRHDLYKFLLQTMVDEHKFKLQTKLGHDILNAVVEGVLPLNEETKPILKDALVILSSKVGNDKFLAITYMMMDAMSPVTAISQFFQTENVDIALVKEIKLTVLRNQTASDPDMDVQEKAAHIAKKFIITQIVKKNMVEEIIPKVVDLKQMLVKQRSPLLKEVMLYLLELNRDYKKEIQEIADHQLVAEIEFDLRKFEEQQQLEAREQNVTPAIQGSPVASGPQPSPRPGSASPAVRSPARKMPSTPPRSPGMRSPAARSPLVQAGSPKPCTPHRKPPNSVSRVAMLNSARRAMEKNKTTPRAPLPAIDQSNESRRVSFETNDSSKNGKAATPKDTRNLYRAISTPSAAMTDITFNGDGNMTFLPPSPIQETAPIQRMFDESNYRLSNEMEESEEEPLVVCIDMPAEALTPAKVVTRTSPEPQSNKEGRVSIGNEELNPTPLATIQPDTANQRRASTRKSQSKDSPKPAAADQRRASTRKSLSKDLQHPKDQPTDNIESQKAKLKKGRKRKL